MLVFVTIDASVALKLVRLQLAMTITLSGYMPAKLVHW